MKIHNHKAKEGKSQSVANEVAQSKSGGEANGQFVDKRPEATAQRKLQEMMNKTDAREATENIHSCYSKSG
jgi:hypothetical protein